MDNPNIRIYWDAESYDSYKNLPDSLVDIFCDGYGEMAGLPDHLLELKHCARFKGSKEQIIVDMASSIWCLLHNGGPIGLKLPKGTKIRIDIRENIRTGK